MTGVMQMFVGGAVMTPTQNNASMPATMTVTDQRTTASTASLTLNSSGTCTSVGNQASVSFTWLTGAGTGANYEARATVISGSPSGTTGSWLALSSSRTWSVTDSTGSGPITASLTIEIRDASTLTVYTTSTLSLSAYQAI